MVFGRRKSQPLSMPPRELLESLRPGPGQRDTLPQLTQDEATGVLQLALDDVSAAATQTSEILLNAIRRLSEEAQSTRAAARHLSTPPPVGALPTPDDEPTTGG
jgi:hypothetical protein